MAYKIFLTDDSGTYELPPLEVPLTLSKDEGQKRRIPLSGNVYLQYIYTKRIWNHSWAYLRANEYQLIEDIYERQKALRKFPLLTIEGENVTDLVVEFTMGDKNIIDNCGDVENLSVSFRETRQLGA